MPEIPHTPLIILCWAAVLCSIAGGTVAVQVDYRLPHSLWPTHYDLYLHPDILTGNFTGQELIHVDVHAATKQIILHSHKLSINHVYVVGTNGINLEVQSIELDPVREFLIVHMVEVLRKDTAVKVGIVFDGQMQNKIVGLYSSSYLTPKQELRRIATSKFEPTYARQAFPCFDEPAMKATFDITLVHPKDGGYHALSNMNVDHEKNQGALTEVYFNRSVPMSTYLACFIVSDFAHHSKAVDTHGLGSNFDIRIFATAHQLDKVNFALDTAVAVTEFYIKYFQVAYPLPKLDMAAIPDFVSNAMEHWGLVTYRETALLYDRSFSSSWNKQRIAHVVAHELAHMWFGDLVTMMWWNDLWLNEGFARYMEYKGVHEVHNDWGMTDQFLIHALQGVMKYDASVASHPIIKTVENPDQITEIFDTISYEKGASVIRMLEDAVGVEKFARAVTSYLTKFQFQNAVTDDFITEVETMDLDFDVKLMIRTWTEQMGLPVVQVKRSSPYAFTLTQKRFLSNIEDYAGVHKDSAFNYTWSIPITFYLDGNSTIQRTWFDYTASEVQVAVPREAKWLKLNIGQVGYYRVNYEDIVWQQIIEDLVAEPESFSIADRAHLFNDIFALADASQLSYEVALDITRYLEKETDFVPWYVAASKLQALHLSLMYTDTYVEYLKYARNLIAKIYAEVTWNVSADNHLRNRLRVTILNAACSLGVPDCLSQAALKFNAWLMNPQNSLEPDLREIVYYYGIQQMGNPQTWDRMWKLFIAEEDASEKNTLMYGLSAVRVPWLLHRFLDLAANESYVRRQDYFRCVQNIAVNAVGEHVVWEYVRERWPDLVQRFGLNERYLGRMIPTLTERFATETKLQEMRDFFEKYPEAGAGTAARKQAMETVKYNIEWLQQNKDKVARWLAKQRQ